MEEMDNLRKLINYIDENSEYEDVELDDDNIYTILNNNELGEGITLLKIMEYIEREMVFYIKRRVRNVFDFPFEIINIDMDKIYIAIKSYLPNDVGIMEFIRIYICSKFFGKDLNDISKHYHKDNTIFEQYINSIKKTGLYKSLSWEAIQGYNHYDVIREICIDYYIMRLLKIMIDKKLIKTDRNNRISRYKEEISNLFKSIFGEKEDD